MENIFEFLFRGNYLNAEKIKISGFKIIDLSKTVTMETIVPGDSGYSDPETNFDGQEYEVPCRYNENVKIGQWVTMDTKKYHITKITMGAHAGTHIDAPMHAKYNGKSIDEIDQNLVGECCLIDLNEDLTVSDLREKIGKIKKNKSIIVLRGKSNYAIPSEFRTDIINSAPKAVVFGDCVNVGSIDDTIKYCEADIPMIMDATNLQQLSGDEIIFALPIKFSKIEAAPVRLFALKFEIVEEEENESFEMIEE